MGSAISPPSLLQPQNPTMPAATTAAAAAGAPSLLEANGLRLAVVAQRFQLLFASSSRSPEELLRLCISLARGVDYALSKNDVPKIALKLPLIVKQVYQLRNDDVLQSAVVMLMIAIKNACRNKWFRSGDSEELLKMANELLGNFCTGINITIELGNALNTIAKIIPRFYPQLKLGRLLVFFEAKPGYEVLMSDFHIEKFTAGEETVRLFVAQVDNLETSSCLINPPQVSFLVNGKGVAGRTNVFQDRGPQFPTDITKMLKYGTNIIQTVGYFSGSYIIAVAVMSKASHFPQSELKEYIQPAITTLASVDSEITEGPSRISLNCPISLKRIRTPVKGYLCKHLQCFDYDNFLEMNSIKPSWRCPFCNQPISFIDLRTDQNMVKILRDVPGNASIAVISSDGSWNVVFDNDKSATHQDQDIRFEPNGVQDTQEKVADLTVDEGKACEIDDIKPLKNVQPSPVFEPSLQQAHIHYANIRNMGTLESLVPANVLNPVITDAISPPSLSINQQISTLPNTQSIFGQVCGAPHRMQARPDRSQAFCSYQLTRPDPSNLSFNIPTNSPSGSNQTIQKTPANAITSNSSERACPHLMNSGSNNVRGLPIVSYQTSSSITAVPNGDIDMLQVSSGLDIGPHLQQFHTMTENQVPACQSSVSLGSRAVGAYNAQHQPLSDHNIPLNQLTNNARGLQSLSQCTRTVQPQLLAAAQRMPQMIANAPTTGSLPTIGNPPQFVGVENLQNMVSDQNWQPTRRMRGSLTGSAYANAINRYMVHPSQLVPNSNGTNMNASLVQPANWRQGGSGH